MLFYCNTLVGTVIRSHTACTVYPNTFRAISALPKDSKLDIYKSQESVNSQHHIDSNIDLGCELVCKLVDYDYACLTHYVLHHSPNGKT